MIQLYDEALLDYLVNSFSNDVKIVPVSEFWRVIAMHKENSLQLPSICISRSNQAVDPELKSWVTSRMGMIDRVEKHRLVTEQSMPISLNYNLTLLATKQDDIDELTSEVIFLIVNKPRVTITIPYGSNRNVNAQISMSGDITEGSLRDTFSDTGILYQTVIPIRMIGANLYNIENRNLRYLRWELRIKNNKIKEEITDAKNKHHGKF